MLDEKFEYEKLEAEKRGKSPSDVERAPQAGLCISVYRAIGAKKGYPSGDLAYWSGFWSSLCSWVLRRSHAGYMAIGHPTDHRLRNSVVTRYWLVASVEEGKMAVQHQTHKDLYVNAR
jgi:hypothetical protein